MDNRLAFWFETDKLREILRKTRIMSGARLENTAEHSWHLGLLVMTSHSILAPNTDLLKSLKMALIHDIVEIDAGDVLVYEAQNNPEIYQTELAAAHRIFGLLEDEMAAELIELWKEFEAKESPEARFVKALDRFHPLLCNFKNKGGTWIEHKINRRMVENLNFPYFEEFPELKKQALELLNISEQEGYLLP